MHLIPPEFGKPGFPIFFRFILLLMEKPDKSRRNDYILEKKMKKALT